MEAADHPSITSYLDIAGHAFGTKGRITVMIIMNLEIYLVAVGLLIQEVDSLRKLFPEFMINLGELTVDGRQSFAIITFLIILPTIFLTDLSILSYISATGFFSCLVILVSIFCVGAFNGVGFHAKGSILLNVDRLPITVSLYIVSFGGHPVIPPIYVSMRDRYQFSKVENYNIIHITFSLVGQRLSAIFLINTPWIDLHHNK